MTPDAMGAKRKENMQLEKRLSLYSLMLKSRYFEEAVKELWQKGAISGEMHSGIGEEAICAGFVSQLEEGDAMALDHRGTPPILMRGVDPLLLLKELLGDAEGLCGGMGGHMHLFSKEHLVSSSGIVGSSGPAAVGYALSAHLQRPGKVALAFFGEGAVNQGMLMEAFNLAVVWVLPVIFICKDNDWAITTTSEQSSGSDLNARARGFGLPVIEVDGSDVAAVYEAAEDAIARARQGEGPTFIRAYCAHPDGHFLGFLPWRIVRHPLKELPGISFHLLKSLGRRKGVPFRERLRGMATVLRTVGDVTLPEDRSARDPIKRTAGSLRTEGVDLRTLEEEIRGQIDQVVAAAWPPASASESVR